MNSSFLFPFVSMPEVHFDAISEQKREAAVEKLRQLPFFSLLQSLKNSLHGSILTPEDGHEYMEARTRPYNQDMWGNIMEKIMCA